MGKKLVAEVRKDFRKSALKNLRNNGRIPAVVYGRGEETKEVSVNRSDLLKLLREHGRNALISLDLNGEVKDAVLSDYQVDSITQEVLHADFLLVDMATEIQARVPITLVGNAKGVQTGGELQQLLYEVTITSKPREIPEYIEVDISELEIGDVVKVADLREKYSSITINHEDDDGIASVTASRVTLEDAEEEVAPTSEPVEAL
ncbi:50S ribosomal protein L25/general stress protein Ctc [Bacillus andreraoultii]|uniref:50S ribosomal protein L25/general stress protein Ctc n=1 Tax=Bacillus andreraoultii TaxID=1499685 RepID=UPI00053B4BB1|nr:50S ribosomal protein L25/general stress protein Ctc [Bacillus andreraoultii]